MLAATSYSLAARTTHNTPAGSPLGIQPVWPFPEDGAGGLYLPGRVAERWFWCMMLWRHRVWCIVGFCVFNLVSNQGFLDSQPLSTLNISVRLLRDLSALLTCRALLGGMDRHLLAKVMRTFDFWMIALTLLFYAIIPFVFGTWDMDTCIRVTSFTVTWPMVLLIWVLPDTAPYLSRLSSTLLLLALGLWWLTECIYILLRGHGHRGGSVTVCFRDFCTTTDSMYQTAASQLSLFTGKILVRKLWHPNTCVFIRANVAFNSWRTAEQPSDPEDGQHCMQLLAPGGDDE